MEKKMLLVVVAGMEGRPYWLTRELGVNVFPAEKRADGFLVVYPDNETRYWEEAKYINSSEFDEAIRRPELHELLFRLEQLAGKEVIMKKFVIKTYEVSI